MNALHKATNTYTSVYNSKANQRTNSSPISECELTDVVLADELFLDSGTVPARKRDKGFYISRSYAFENKEIVGNWKKQGNRAYNSFSGCKFYPKGLLNHLVYQGRAITPAYLGTRKDNNNRLISRNKQNFKGARIVGFDLDNNTSLEDLQNTRLFNEFSFLKHETASSTDNYKKTRAYIVLPHTVKNSNDYEKITKAICRYIEETTGIEPDKTTDATRLFFGAKNAKYIFDSDLYLPEDELEAILQVYDPFYRDPDTDKYKDPFKTKDKSNLLRKKVFNFASSPLAVAGQKALNRFMNKEPIPEGERNDELFRAVYHAYIHSQTKYIEEVSEHAINTGLSYTEVNTTVQSAEKRYIKLIAGELDTSAENLGTNSDAWSTEHILTWRKLLTAILHHNWNSPHSMSIALVAVKMLGHGRSEDFRGRTYIELSGQLMKTVTGMTNPIYKKHLKEVLNSPFFDRSKRRAKLGSQSVIVNLTAFERVKPVELTQTFKHVFTVLVNLISGAKSDLLVWVAVAIHGLDTTKAITEHTGLHRTTVASTLSKLTKQKMIERSGEGNNTSYTVTCNTVRGAFVVLLKKLSTITTAEEPSVQDLDSGTATTVEVEYPKPVTIWEQEHEEEMTKDEQSDYIDAVFSRAVELKKNKQARQERKKKVKKDRNKEKRRYFASLTKQKLQKIRQKKAESEQFETLYNILHNQLKAGH